MLTPEALAFLKALHCEFEPRRQAILQARARRQAAIDSGVRPGFLLETQDVRGSEWQVARPPHDLDCRWVEMVGPADRQAIVSGLNSGADCFVADFGDSLSPTWPNVIEGHSHLHDAIRRDIDFVARDGRPYRLSFNLATLVVRPRGWHLDESRVKVGGKPMSGSLFDFGLHMFHNGKELLARGSGPYFCLPKLQTRLEARLWNDVFTFAQERLGIPHGTIRASVIIEHILAAFEMEEILFELKEHASGLVAGRWNYVFSAIKTFGRYPELTLPDRGDVGMTVPFLRAFTELLVRTCHRRGAHAIGGVNPFVPGEGDSDIRARAIEAVRSEMERESHDGFDGTSVAHAGLVPLARAAFGAVLGADAHHKDRYREDVRVGTYDLMSLADTGGRVTRVGMELNVCVALEYLTSWLRGRGSVAMYDSLEDASAAEISRAQLWQWVRHEVPLDDGSVATPALYAEIRAQQVQRLTRRVGNEDGRLDAAAEWLDTLVLGDACPPFMVGITGAA
ncbi:MAG: malate synthase A [Gemmatimonadota bacterium]|nr:malate synthase A [Gemmatimonadota bacterium]